MSSSFEPYESRLAQLKQSAAGREEDKTVFRDICRLRRNIALQNPLINFDEILFQSFEGAHDNQQGHNNPMRANGGEVAPFDSAGGLYKLRGIKNENVEIIDLTAGVPVQNGRYQGKILSNSSPEGENGHYSIR